MAREAAELYAWGVEVGSRMAGISGGPPSSQLAEVLARPSGRRRARIPASRPRSSRPRWIQWATSEKGYLDESFTERVVEGLALAREVGDPLLLSSALDAASSTSSWQGRFREAAAQSERLEVLARTPASPAVAAERTDALYMLTQSLTARAGFARRSNGTRSTPARLPRARRTSPGRTRSRRSTCSASGRPRSSAARRCGRTGSRRAGPRSPPSHPAWRRSARSSAFAATSRHTATGSSRKRMPIARLVLTYRIPFRNIAWCRFIQRLTDADRLRALAEMRWKHKHRLADF